MLTSKPNKSFRVFGLENSANQFFREFVERPFTERSRLLFGLDTNRQTASSRGRALCIFPTFAACINQSSEKPMSEIKAIETQYKGHRFRSRVEARWAIFLDELGVEWEYEKEGFDLDGLWYLPDFWVPIWNAFIEIKGVSPDGCEIEKAIRLAKKSQSRVFVVIGNPDPKTHRILFIGNSGDINPMDDLARFRQCQRCPDIFLEYIDCNGNPYAAGAIGHPDVAAYMKENPNHECADKWPVVHGRIERAFRAACSARFEHGEGGAA